MLTDTIKTDNHVAVGGVGSYFGITKLPFNLGDFMKITGYKLVIYYEDGATEDIVDIPYHIEKRIESHLDELEAETEYEEWVND